VGKRRIIFDDDAEYEDKEEGRFSIDNGKEGVTLINIPSTFVQKVTSSTARGYELMRFHLTNTKVNLTGGLDVESNIRTVSLGTIEAVETLLMHCIENLDSGDSPIIAPILSAFGAGMLNIALEASDQNQAKVSIRLLPAVPPLGRTAPPIPTPCRLPGGTGFSQPHPSYTLLQALGGIFKGSIFDDVAISLANPQQQKKEEIITAKMVYGVVDNVHAKEFEQEGGETSTLDIPGLVPTLRPYQDAAVRWMLKRERICGSNTDSIDSDESNNEWELCWYVVVESPTVTAGHGEAESFARSHILPLPDWRKGKSSPDERQVFCNPFSGWLASSYEEAKKMMLWNEEEDLKGGILAESMGLGKTVEVLACILANPSPLSLQVPNPPDALSANAVDEAKSSHDAQIANDQKRQNTAGQKLATKPSAIHDAVCICGRSADYNGCLSWVVCEGCGEAMHGHCAGFQSDEEVLSKTKEDPNAGFRLCTWDCPSCAATVTAQNGSSSIIESRATLIVTPPAILTQWSREIKRHTKDPATGKPLKVAIYPGVRDLCCAGSQAPHENFHLVHPSQLADADVVLVTFQALMSDLGHSNDNPFTGLSKEGGSRLRSRKRYKVLPSPLTSVKWWRVCLDEAQRVEMPTAASARMAHKLLTDKRWCVSGTPIGRGRLEDLHGLLLFLSFKPFDEKRWFSKTFSLSHGDALNRLSHLLKDIMWRSTKANRFVRQQMGIPEQEEQKKILQFSSVERYFYDRQYEETFAAVSKWTNAKGCDFLSNSLQRLRAACCHPQVGASGIGDRIRRKQGTTDRVLSMDQILEKLIEDARGKCEEAQRIATLHTNGLACLTKLKADSEGDDKLLDESMRLYQEALDLADSNASPTEIIGTAVLGGSQGFQSNQKTINNGTATLEWQIKTSSEKSTDCTPAFWSSINIAGPAKTISCIKIRTCHALPPLQGGSWTILRPKDCVIQMSSAAVGGGFVNVHPFTLADNKDALGDEWQEISGFHAKKSKAWRLLIKTCHNEMASDSCQYARLDVQLFEPEIVVDNLQRLHILSNASLVLSSLAQAGDDRPWYEDCLAWFALNGNEQEKRNLLETVHRDLSNYYDNTSGVDQDQVLIRRGKFPNYNTVDGLHMTLVMRIQKGKEEVGLRNDMDHKKCIQGILQLSSTPKEGEVYKNSHCQRCRKDWQQTGPVCSHCHLEDDLVKFQRLSNDPEITCVLKTIDKVVKGCQSRAGSPRYLRSICQRSCAFFKVQDRVRQEIVAAKFVWKAHFDLLSDIDELNQCKRAMRLRQEGEDISVLTENEAAFIVDLSSISAELMDHQVKQATSLAALRRNKDSLRYLKNQRLERSVVEATNQTDGEKRATSSNTSYSCTVCLSAFDSERSVLPCGHMFHPICVDHLFKRRSGCSTIQCPMRCPMVVRREDVLLASNKSKKDGSRTSREVKGNWGTKVNHLIGDVLDALHMGDKGIIFSQWDEMLEIAATALSSNNVFFIRPRSGKNFGEDIKRFQISDVPILLMNVKNGAEGLTLTEANHIFMIEPILNCGLDMQAINRIHRIGQASKTYVHRYIVANTVEERIDEIRMERQENHFEDDLQLQKKHSIKGGGIDGGFDVSELQQLFG
ncbi:hypothetical protein ACHAXR_013142, partial [Thalassiosira sp. AJA248-18]